MKDDYGKGRLKVISEMEKWVSKEIQKIKDAGKNESTHVQATMSGQIRAYSAVLQKLKSKKQNLKS